MLFLSVSHAALINWEYMDVIRFAADPKVFLQPCLLYPHYRFPAQNWRPARLAEKTFRLRGTRVRSGLCLGAHGTSVHLSL